MANLLSWADDKRKRLAEVASQRYDQLNVFDNGLSDTTRKINPGTNPFGWENAPKSTFQQALPIAKGIVRAPAQMLNTAARQVPLVDYSIRQNIAARTGNQEAYRNATRNVQAAQEMFNQQEGGLFNTGTFYGADDAARGDLKTGVQKIGGGTLQTAATVLPFAKGGSVMTSVGRAPLLPLVPKLAAEGAAYGLGFSVGHQAQETGKIDPKVLLRDTAFGTVGNVALPAAARGVANTARTYGPVLKEGLTVRPDAPAPTTNPQAGFIRLPGGQQVDDPLYHGSPRADDIRREGFKLDPSLTTTGNTSGRGIYLSGDKGRALDYAGDPPNNNNLLNVDIPKDAKIYRPKDIIKELYGGDTGHGDPALITKKFQKLGYDGIELSSGGKNTGDVVMFDPKKVSVANKSKASVYDTSAGNPSLPPAVRAAEAAANDPAIVGLFEKLQGLKKPGEWNPNTPAHGAYTAANRDFYKALQDRGITSIVDQREVEAALRAGVKAPAKTPDVPDYSNTPVYHGTMQDFDQFSKDALGSNTKAGSAQEGFFFTPQREVAESYASNGAVKPQNAQQKLQAIQDQYQKVTGEDTRTVERKIYRNIVFGEDMGYSPEITKKVNQLKKQQDQAEKILEKYGEDYFAPADATAVAKGGQVKEAYLNMKNPLVYDMKGAERRPEKYVDIIKQAKAAGHDGVIIKNTFDRRTDFGENINKPHDVYVAFDEKQIGTTSSKAKAALAEAVGNEDWDEFRKLGGTTDDYRKISDEMVDSNPMPIDKRVGQEIRDLFDKTYDGSDPAAAAQTLDAYLKVKDPTFYKQLEARAAQSGYPLDNPNESIVQAFIREQIDYLYPGDIFRPKPAGNLEAIAQADVNGRPHAAAQTAYENAKNAGDDAAMAKAGAELDPAMRGEYTLNTKARDIFIQAARDGKPISMEQAKLQAAQVDPALSGGMLPADKKAQLLADFQAKAAASRVNQGGYINPGEIAHDIAEGAKNAAQAFKDTLEKQLKGTGMEGGSSEWKNHKFTRRVIDSSKLVAEPEDGAAVKSWTERIKAGERPEILTGELGGELHVIDGNHKLQAYKDLGITEVPTIHAASKTKAVSKKTSDYLKELPTDDARVKDYQAKLRAALADPNPRLIKGRNMIADNMEMLIEGNRHRIAEASTSPPKQPVKSTLKSGQSSVKSTQPLKAPSNVVKDTTKPSKVKSGLTPIKEVLDKKPPIVPPKPPKKTGPTGATPEPKKPNTSKLNTARLATNKKNKAYLDKETEAVIGRMSDKEINELAKHSGLDLESYPPAVTRRKIAEQLNVRRDAVLALKEADKARKAGDTDATAKALLRAAERGRLSREQGTDVARQLSARRIIANELDTPEQRIFTLLDKAGVNPEVYTKRLATVDFKDGNQVIAAYREMVPATAANWIDKYRYTNMLSSPLTHMVNITSNAQGLLGIAPLQKLFEGGVDAVRAGVNGKPRTRYASEAGSYYKGAVTSIPEGLRKFKDVMTGKQMMEMPDADAIKNAKLAYGGVAGAADNVLSFIPKLLEASDQLAMTVARGAEKASYAKRTAKGAKIVGDVDGLIDDAAKYRVFRQELGKAGQGHLLDAVDAIPSAVLTWRNSKNPIVANLAKYTLPFVTTPTNLFKQGIEYSPAGILTLAGNTNKTAQVAKMLMGTTTVALAAGALASKDAITFSEPSDAKQRDAFRSEGKQPYAIKVWNPFKKEYQWIGYSKLHPAIAFNLATVAAYKDAMDKGAVDQSQADKMIQAASGVLGFFRDQSYMKSVGDFTNGLQLKDGANVVSTMTHMASNYANQLSPFKSMVSWIGRQLDPTQRKVDTKAPAPEQLYQNLIKDIPGLNKNVPTRKNPYTGEDIKNDNPILNAWSPLRVTNDRGFGNTTGLTVPQRQIQQSLGKDEREVFRKQVINEKYQTKQTNQQKEDIKAAAAETATTKLADGKYYAKVGDEYKTFDNAKDAATAVEKKKFETSSDKTRTIGDTFYYKNKDGGVSSKPVYKHDYELTSTSANLQMDRAKASNDVESWYTEANKKATALQTYIKKLDPDTDTAEINSKTLELENLLDEAEKYQKYGNSFTKYGSGSSSSSRRRGFQLPGGGGTASALATTQRVRQLLKNAKVSVTKI